MNRTALLFVLTFIRLYGLLSHFKKLTTPQSEKANQLITIESFVTLGVAEIAIDFFL
ncbi:hypothetical protein ACQUY5_29635 [Bacillus cereus]|uniref:hypothetical protein n=1 Tax=Bacillus cereus group TaxID=86661 RepID=UPI000892B14C|nr:hypothetical protein [Bacillus mycoides]OFD36309.1 hypothetical protein BWGOE1_55950 [Bacillus mycoides]OFD55280.1 hypothetical protein BWGOE6_55050 [Bacillus mycoides]